MSTDLFKTLKTISAFHHYNFWIYKNISPYLSGTILDVGSGIGDVAKYYLRNPGVSKVILSDGSGEMLSFLKKYFTDTTHYGIVPLDITKKDMTSSWNLSVDTVTCINVLEHIEDDLQALKHIQHLVKAGGRLVLMVPAVPAIYGTLDSLVGHYRRYTMPMLERLFAKTGFTIEKKFYMNMFGIFTWYIAGKILKQTNFEPRPCSILDKLVPVLRGLESFCQPPIGQSLIIVGIKD